MRTVLATCAVLIFFAAIGDSRPAPEPCRVQAVVVPAVATADHNLPPPGNEVQFTAKWTVTGMCPMPADRGGPWTTSDTVNTSVSAVGENGGIHARAICLGPTPKPAIISYGGRIRAFWTFKTATLTCK
jgi:hypothetical protein